MTRLVQSSLHDFVTMPSTGPGLLLRLRRHFGRVGTEMARQARLAALQSETLRDTGLTPDDLTDAPSHDPALPFVLQASFGRHDR